MAEKALHADTTSFLPGMYDIRRCDGDVHICVLHAARGIVNTENCQDVHPNILHRHR